jgi:glyoxylase-like metal-dependent hydrolase (beta-lactamase superfamily II)
MKILATGKVADGVFVVNHGFVNSYIVTDGTDAVCFDCGLIPGRMAVELAKLNLSGKVSSVFLTHSDRDHVGGLRAFPDAKVYLGESEEQMVNGTTKRRVLCFSRHNRLATAHTLLEDDQEIRAGGITVRGIFAPGHTPGSMCFLVNGQYLFTGDLLILKDGKAMPTTPLISMDRPESVASIRKLAGSLHGVTALFTAHGGMTGDFDTAMAEYRS